jgi:WD40 repeat protein
MSIFRLLFCSLIVLTLCFSEVLHAQPAYILHKETGHAGGISNTKFTLDGKLIISSALRDSSLLIWDGETGNYLYSINTHPNFSNDNYPEEQGITLFEISNNSRLVAAATSERTLHILDLIQKKEIRSETFASNIIAMRFSPTGDSLLAIEYSGDVHLIDLKTPLPTRVTKINAYEYSPGVSISASLRYIAYIHNSFNNNSDTVAISDIFADSIYFGVNHSWQSQPLFAGHDSLLVTTNDDTIVVWDAKTLTAVNAYYIGDKFKDGISMYPGVGNSTIYILPGLYSSNIVYTLNVLTGELKEATTMPNASARCIGISPDEKKVVTGSLISLPPLRESVAGIVSLYNIETSTLLRQLTTVHATPSASFSGDSKLFSINGDISHISLLSSEDGQFVRPLNGLGNALFESDGSSFGGDLSSNGKYVVFSDHPSQGQWYHKLFVRSTDSLVDIATKDLILYATWNFRWMSGDSTFLCMRQTSYYNNTMFVIPLKGVERELKFAANINPTEYDYRTDSDVIALITYNRDSVYCMHLTDSSFISAFKLLHKNTKVVKLSPRGEKVLTIDRDTSAVLYDVATGLAGKTFTVPGTSINDIAYCSNGKYILTGHSDSSVRVWDVATGLPVFRYDSLGGEVIDIDISNDGSRILACTDNRSVQLLQGINELGVDGPPLSSGSPAMLVYPNPTSSTVMVIRENDEASDVFVYDQTGKMYYKDKAAKGVTRIAIPTQNLAAESYLVKVGSETASFIVTR